MSYFHGGAPGLKWRILPPTLSGVEVTVTDYIERDFPGYAPAVVDRSKVYLTVERSFAEVYAKLHPNGGWLYEVEPRGEVEPDPDWTGPPEQSCRCPWAVILRVVAKYKAADGEEMLHLLRQAGVR